MDSLDQLTGIVSLLVSVGGFIILWKRFRVDEKKTDSESKKTDSEAATEITEGAVALLGAMRTRLEEAESDNKLLKETIREDEEEISTLKRLNLKMHTQVDYYKARVEMLEDWSRRLKEQVASLGKEPAKFDNGHLHNPGLKPPPE